MIVQLGQITFMFLSYFIVFFIFPYPARLNAFQLLNPYNVFARLIVVLNFKCIKNECISSIFELEGEALVLLTIQFTQAVVSMFLGILVSYLIQQYEEKSHKMEGRQ